MNRDYSLPKAEGERLKVAAGWLTVAVGFLLASGVYPLLLALARTTYEMPWKDFFYTALVLHVDFTVLWWLLAIAAVFWTLNSSGKGLLWSRLAMLLVVLGGVLAGIAPLLADANPLTNNYVPMLEGNYYFIAGLMIFGFGILLLVLHALATVSYRNLFRPDAPAAMGFGIWSAALAGLIAIITLLWTYLAMPEGLEGRAYYELLFWAGGHVLQFAHTALMLVCWLWLASICGAKIPGSPMLVTGLFMISVLFVLIAPWPLLTLGLSDPQFTIWYVWLMRDGNGIAAFFIALMVFWGMIRGQKPTAGNHHLYISLLFSIVLFGLGGVLGLFISESSTLITAHYHGSIVAVTMAFMAMAYYWLPQFGYASPNLRWAKIQVYTYAAGQFAHIVGLAWGGGHGMKRKVVGTTQDIGVQAFVTPQDLVGAGGAVAVLSGVLFAIVVLPVMLRGRDNTTPVSGEREV
ncbi:MAG: cbb3-type cytochrome c oxidase subunit I [Mariprofundaceae bacterium]|nr:cbb3-type cytochrome c oxidase subunit I [Mariprofundaceae bacterium]